MKLSKFFAMINNKKSVMNRLPHQQLNALLLLLCCFLSQQTVVGQNIQRPNSIFPKKNEAPAIYINPNPSTRSRTQQQQQQQQRQVSGWLTPDQVGQRQQLKQRRSFADQSPAAPQVGPSSIGKSDQVAEWPFYKSLISSRNNQKNVALQSGPLVNSVLGPSHRLQLEVSEGSTESPSEASTTATMSTTTTTTTTTPTAASTPTTTTTTQAPSSTETPIEATSMSSEMADTTTLTYTEATTGQSPATTTTTPSTTTTTTLANPMNDPLFLPNFHSSLQQAVDRIVKMTSTAKASTTEAPPKQPAQAAGLKSSLSLNVLLKNFGVHNLTNLDQILLRSSLAGNRSNDPQRPTSGVSGEQKLSISGVQNILRKSGLISETSLSGTSDIADETGSSVPKEGPQSAECKIEYTMKHANISLINESGSDYTCDYIIDRKLTLGEGKRIDMERVCKLKLTSEFFSNETGPSCEGTHLSIGQSKYCYLPMASGPTLDRVFEFPIVENAFDIKLVHKQDKESASIEAAAEIHLEIKPLAEDEDCLRHLRKNITSARGQVAPNIEYDAVETMPETQSPIRNMQLSTRSTTTTTTTESPPAATIAPGKQDDQRESSRLRSSTVEVVAPNPGGRNSNDSSRSKKIVVKLAHDNNSTNKLHPLNNRFKVSQSFDLGDTNKPEAHLAHSSAAPIEDKKVQANQRQQQQSQVKLCDTFKHVSTVGQLMTAEYPNYYQANTNCSYIIKRSSIAYCQLLLHFRDFDLINKRQTDQLGQECPEDYLQIGETRYCNRYAMIGHKMRLNFTEMDNYSIRLHFRSDNMQSGRGFLIKYQQLLCDSEQSRDKTIRPSPALETVSTFDEPEPARSSPKTVAPPLQQPDFSLAMKTSNPKHADDSLELKGKEASKFNERTKSQKPPGPKQASSVPSNSNLLQPMASTISSALSYSQASASLESITPTTVRRSSQLERRQCNQVNSEMSFLIKSPTSGGNLSDSYENNLQCMFYVRQNSSQVCYLELTFIRFDLEADSDCRYDFLEINSVRLCGLLRERTTRIYLFNEPIKVIKFHTDQSGSKSGFLIKVDQLECAPNGSIRRQAKQIESEHRPASVDLVDRYAPAAVNLGRLGSSVSNHSQRVFEYDALTIPRQKSPPARTLPDPSSYIVPASFGSTDSSNLSSPIAAPTTSANCDELLYGPEVVIRSPFWPESYLRPGADVSACKYTILRNSAIGDKICQIELRLVNLRLGPADCIEIVGHELLCGFNARNMLRYYQFGESQTHLMIRFLPGGGGFKARTASSTLSSDDPTTTGDDILPVQGRPLRFMLVAKQHECIDGFLSPSMADHTNRTNLLYHASGQEDVSASIRPSANNQTESKRQPDRTTKQKMDSILKYDFSSTLSALKVNSSKSPSSLAKQDTYEPAQMKLINRMPLIPNHRQQAAAEQNPDERCHIQFSQYNGIVSSASVLSTLRRSQRNECELKFRLLPGFCRVQLTFGEFGLDQRIVGLCLGDYLEIDKFRYCSNELRNTTRVLIGSPLDSFVTMKLVLATSAKSSSIHGFRAIFKQIECDQPLVEPILKPISQQVTSLTKSAELTQISPASQQIAQPNDIRSSGGSHIGDTRVLFKEIAIRSEFFELNVANLSGESLDRAQGYGPSMFVVYRIKRARPEVCKLRLMFYRFDLEPSPGCKRDFLDVNNVDRLCGRLDKAEDTRRDYEWPQREVDRDFLISFVSDSSIQGEGFLLFGQQLVDNSDCKPAHATKGDSPADPKDSATPSEGLSPEQGPQKQHQQPASMFDEDTATASQDKTHKDSSRPNPITETKDENDSNSNSSSGVNMSENCSKLFYEDRFHIASPNWPQQYVPKMTCYYLIHKARPDACSVTLNIRSMILDTSSNGDEMQPDFCDPNRSDHLDIDGRLRCGLINSPKSETIEFGRRQFVTVKFVSVQASGFGFFIEAMQNNCSGSEAISDGPMQSVKSSQNQQEPGSSQTLVIMNNNMSSQLATVSQARCNELIVNEMSLIESDNFPGNYKHNQDCLFVVRRQNQSVCAIDLTLKYFDLEPGSGQTAGDNQCDGDYLEIDYSRFCGSYPVRHRLRFSYFGDELDKLIKFHSDASVSRSGFSAIVRQVSDCDRQQSAQNQQEQSIPSGNNDEIISYLPDSSTTSTNKQQETAPTGPGSEEQFKKPVVNASLTMQPIKNESANSVPHTLCQFTYNKESQYLLSPNYNKDKVNYDSNVDCIYRIRAKSYDICSLKLTFVDLDLENSIDCTNDYLLLDNRRYCGHSLQASPSKVVEVQFSDSLPREIHLLYHTDAHLNEGRGFKLLYEQQACDKHDDQRFQLQNGDMRMDHLLLAVPGLTLATSSGLDERQTRRMKFGLLDYPKNYVSDPNDPTRRTANRSAIQRSGQPANRPEMLLAQHANNDEEMTIRGEIRVANTKKGPIEVLA